LTLELVVGMALVLIGILVGSGIYRAWRGATSGDA
jgi:hypothetical protein